MKRECVFRCQFSGNHYSIYASQHPKREGETIYWTYVGRRLFDRYHWNTFAGAIGSILLSNGSFDISDFKNVWL